MDKLCVAKCHRVRVIRLREALGHLTLFCADFRIHSSGDPEELTGTQVSKLLAASDWHVFRDATRSLMEVDSHMVEVRFKVKLFDPEGKRDPGQAVLYQLMEGKGMLMMTVRTVISRIRCGLSSP